MQGLMLHAGGVPVTREQVSAIPTPEKTGSYQPVPYSRIINHVHDRIENYLGLEIESEGYGLNKSGMQFFGVLRCKTDNPEHGLAIGMRSSHDKSMSVGLAAGLSVFVCDNLCFSGDSITYIRKHTLNVWRDVLRQIDRTLLDSQQNYELAARDLDQMRMIPMRLDDGYDLIGRAMGHKILGPRQASSALHDWRTPRHEQFADRNLHSLYQCFTEALKTGTPGGAMDRYSRTHEWFRPMLPSRPTTHVIEA